MRAVVAVAALAALAVAGGAPGASSPKPVPVEDFVRIEKYHSAKVSPRGEYLAVDMQSGRQRAVGVLQLPARTLIGSLVLPYGRSVADYWWVAPDRLMAAVGFRGETLDHPIPSGELYAIDADGTDEEYVFGFMREYLNENLDAFRRKDAFNRATMLQPWTPVADESLVAVVPFSAGIDGGNPTLEAVNIRTGAIRRVDMLPLYPPFDVSIDDAGRPRYAIGSDAEGNTIQLVRDKPEDEWRKRDMPKGLSIDAEAGFIAGHRVYLASNEEGDRRCLRTYRLDTGKGSNLSCHPVVDLGGTQYLSRAETPAAVVYENGKPETVFLAPEGEDARVLRNIMAGFPGQRVTITSVTSDGGRIVFLVSSDRNPGDFYLFDRKTNTAEFLMSRREWIKPEKMASMEPVDFPARDGVVLHGYITRPKVPTDIRPLVVMPHGGPHGVRDYWAWDPWVQFLASRGYTVLQVNFRGSGGYGRAHEEAGYRKWGTLIQDDITDGARWAIATGHGEAGRLCIVGASFGGYSALMGAEREPDLYRCAVSLAGVYDLKSQHLDSGAAESRLGRAYLERVLGSDPEQLAEQSPVTHVERLKIPVLIAHGTYDVRAPFSQAEALRQALKKNRKPYQWETYSREQHGFADEKNAEEFFEEMLDFLDEHIGKDSKR